MMGRRCPRCQKFKKAGDFYSREKLKDGLSVYCRECTKSRQAERKSERKSAPNPARDEWKAGREAERQTEREYQQARRTEREAQRIKAEVQGTEPNAAPNAARDEWKAGREAERQSEREYQQARRAEREAQRIKAEAQRIEAEAQRIEAEAQRAEREARRIEMDPTWEARRAVRAARQKARLEARQEARRLNPTPKGSIRRMLSGEIDGSLEVGVSYMVIGEGEFEGYCKPGVSSVATGSDRTIRNGGKDPSPIVGTSMLCALLIEKFVLRDAERAPEEIARAFCDDPHSNGYTEVCVLTLEILQRRDEALGMDETQLVEALYSSGLMTP